MYVEAAERNISMIWKISFLYWKIWYAFRRLDLFMCRIIFAVV